MERGQKLETIPNNCCVYSGKLCHSESGMVLGTKHEMDLWTSQSVLFTYCSLPCIGKKLPKQDDPRQIFCPSVEHLHPVWGPKAFLVLPIWL